ncbi:MAG: AbrB/MazE/SpoVT family DNA-binding domain-containing protein [Spirochaetia bacterium]|jgi:AbrB family looped-hinge helix DNA binding protein|nr:AbrB/MazE/SpoVT family DNA-binding domain-containing protein [Spirochaetia bacterium]
MKIMERGQLTIPKKYRDLYGIRPDTELEIVPKEEGLLIVKKQMNSSLFREVFGILGKDIASDQILEEIRGR